MTDALNEGVFNLPDSIRLAAGFLSALIITWVSIPVIVKISKFKNLYSYPNERTSHTSEIPVLGGLAVIAGFTLSVIVFSPRFMANELLYVLGGLLILFYIGIKDDIMMIDPKKKLAGQVAASVLVVWIGGIRITNFHNAFGIETIAPWISIVFTVLVFLVLINGFNLIDGIDGLASAIGILVSGFFGLWFILNGHINYGVMAASLTGTLIAFFRFNVFGKKNKIFLGDTGSLVIGLIVAVMTVKFLEFDMRATPGYRFHAAPAVAFGLLILPLFDTLRVFILRLRNGKPPFKADRNHIHHALLTLGLSHLNATIVIAAVNLILLAIAILLQPLGIVPLTLIILVLVIALSFIPGLILRHREH